MSSTNRVICTTDCEREKDSLRAEIARRDQQLNRYRREQPECATCGLTDAEAYEHAKPGMSDERKEHLGLHDFKQANGRADRIFDLLNERGAFRGAPQVHRAITVQIIREALNEPERTEQPSPQGTVSGAEVQQFEPDALFASAQEPTNESRLLSRPIHLQIEAYFAARADVCRFLAYVERVLISEREPPLNPVISNYAVTSDRDASFRVAFNEPRRT